MINNSVKKFSLFVIALLTFLILDAVWLGLISRSFYSTYLGTLLTDDIKWWAVLVFYPLFVFGLTLFVLCPNYEKGSFKTVFLYGVIFGFVAYATYDLTNTATLKGWPFILTCVDMAWGAIIGGVTSIATLYIFRKLIIAR